MPDGPHAARERALKVMAYSLQFHSREELIEQVGCSNIHIRCESTAVNYILDAYSDTGMTGEKNLAEAHEVRKRAQA